MPDVFDSVATYILESGVPRLPGGSSPQNIVAVSGAAALGKTTFSRNLAAAFARRGLDACHMELDGYLQDRTARQTQRISGYDPSATRFAAMLNDLDGIILRGEPRDVPIYDHAVGRVSSTVRADPKRIVILDGIVSLHHEVRDRYPSFGIFIEASDIVMRGLRLEVDLRERGYTVFGALQHIDVESKDYDRWIHHQSAFADLRIVIDEERHFISLVQRPNSY